MPQFTFNSIDEIKEFVKSLKGTRGAGKGDDEGEKAPAPVMPPGAASGFGPAPGPFGAPTPAFGGGVAPEVMALVVRITSKLDAAVAAGQSADQAVGWFRGQCGPEAAAATMDQIKGVFLPRLTVPALDNICKLMGA